MDVKSVIDFIQGVGFPIAVAWFVLARVEKRLMAIEAAIVAVLERVRSNEARHDADWSGGATPSRTSEEVTERHRIRRATPAPR
jgi:hypothetical protein